MPAPAISSAFATAAAFTVDGDTWGGDPTKVDPGAARRAEGFEPDTLPAEWLNFQLGLLGDWDTWLEAERARLASYIGGSAGSSEWAYPSARARVSMIPLAQAMGPATEWDWSPGGVPHWRSNAAVSTLRAGIVLPTGSTITKVEAIVDPFDASNTIRCHLKGRIWSAGYSTLTAVTHAGVAGGGGASRQNISATPGAAPTVVGATDEWYIEVVSTVSGDIVEGLLVFWNDPGPRNY